MQLVEGGLWRGGVLARTCGLVLPLLPVLRFTELWRTFCYSALTACTFLGVFACCIYIPRGWVAHACAPAAQ